MIDDMDELHSKLSILGAIDVGIVVVDNENNIQMWNEFMQNHSGLRPSEVRHKNLFRCCPGIDQVWFQRKIDRVRPIKLAGVYHLATASLRVSISPQPAHKWAERMDVSKRHPNSA